MRKSILIFLFTLIGVFSARAYDFEDNGVYYIIISGKDQVEVTYASRDRDGNSEYYSGSVIIPSTVMYRGTSYTVISIGKNAFSECTGLTSVTIGESVTTIGDEAFLNCEGLTSVTLPNSVTSIGDCAFVNTSISTPLYNNKVFAYMPQNATGGYAIPPGIQSIAGGAFFGCNWLISVTIPNGVTTIGTLTFSGCTRLASVKIPNSVTTIGNYAFNACSGLTSLKIPESVATIGDLAFYGCSRLASLTIPEGVTAIGVRTFYGCSGLTSVTIPESVTSIGFEAFLECTALTSVTCLAEMPISYSSSYPAFSVYDTLFVPRGCKAAYQTAKEWKKFAVIKETPSLVTLLVNDEVMGVVTGDGEYAYGTQVTLAAAPNPGYHFVKWSDDNTDNPRTLTVTEDTTLTVMFAPNIYTVTIQSNDASMGTVSGGDTYAFGTEATLTAIPTTGYHFVKWNDGNTDNPRMLTVVCDTTFTAVFAKNEEKPDEPVVKTFTVSVLANNPAWGSVSQSGAGNYDSASLVTITATPNEGYHFEKWNDDNTDTPRVLTVTKDTAFTAVFAKNEEKPDKPVVKTFTVSVSANNPAWGSVSQSGDGIYDSAASVTITATPNEGYHFEKWNDDNTDNPRVLTITKDTAFTAVFAKNEEKPDKPVVKTFTVSVSANNPAWGGVSQSGEGTYDSAASVTITATSNEGYHFINWTKGEAVFSTQADTTFMVTENLELVANFEKISEDPVANENRKDDHFRVYVQNRTICLSEARGLVQVYNMAGQCVYNGYATAIPVQKGGVYILVAGSQHLKVLVR